MSLSLVMLGLGIQSDHPPVEIQPRLLDGVHLRWAFKRNVGFPWWGYFLYRRPSGQTRSVCLSSALNAQDTGELPQTTLTLSSGTLASDRNLRLIDAFPTVGRVEVDLSDRSLLQFSVPSNDLASHVDLKIGFLENRSLQLDCLDLRSITQPPAQNPTRIGQFTFELVDAAGNRRIRPIVWREGTNVVGGLELQGETQIHLDHVTDEVTLQIVHTEGGVRATAQDRQGNIVSTAETSSSQAGKTQELLLRSADSSIARVTLVSKDRLAGLLRVCSRQQRQSQSSLRVVAMFDGIAMTETAISGKPGEVISVSLEADAINQVAILPYNSFQLPDAALIDLCYVSVNVNRRRGWEPMPDCRQPITLPIFHPDYPATGFAPLNLPAAEAEALGRVRYGDPSPLAGAPFSEMHDALEQIVRGGPFGPAMSDPARAEDVSGVSTSPSTTAAPTLSGIHPLDLLLTAAIHPTAAQMLGLAWVDKTAEPGQAYDYLVIGDQSGTTDPDPLAVLKQWLNDVPGYDGFIVWNKRVQPQPPLAPPQDSQAFSLPLGAAIAPGGSPPTPVDTAGLVGLRWKHPMIAGVLLPDSFVCYHLWRDGLGNAETPTASVELGTWLTKSAPILIGQPIGSPFSIPQRPADWPNFPMHRIDRIVKEGWYGYRVSGMDLFGRISKPSSLMPWHQWSPAPTPRPWYYQEPPSDAMIHPDAVRVLDKIPPPPPVGVEATVLDPQDPYVISDAAYLAWRASLPDAVRTTLVGLRVRWRWTASQMLQAPDTKEFRVYFNPGGSLPLPDSSDARNWSDRVHVVPFANAISISPTGSERQYEIFLPAAGGSVFASGVPLTPTLADPVVYAHCGVSAADEALHTADDPKWASGVWGSRAGNEGSLGTPAKVFRVQRVAPAPPVPPPDSERVFATPADYHSHSFYTYRWAPTAHLKTHVLRAMDDSLFVVDRRQRPRAELDGSTAGVYPNPAIEPRWDLLKRTQVANELNGLNTFVPTPEGNAAASVAYRRLSNDALRVLAGLPGNEAAFSQVTIQPLDPADPIYANRLGPDNPPGFVIDPALRIYIDTLDGRSTNRYFYRAVYVDGAHNRSKLSLAGPPIWLPNVVPPRAPVWSSLNGGERRITLDWASNRERDLKEYRVYRTDSEVAARDQRSMTLVQTLLVPPGDPELRPAKVTWVDEPLPGLVNYWYVITAVDEADNESRPSRAAVARAFDESLPILPALTANWTAAAPPADARLTWTSIDETRIERRVLQSLQWDPVGDWHAPGTYDETIPLDATLSWRLRLRVRKYTGAISVGSAVPLNHL